MPVTLESWLASPAGLREMQSNLPSAQDGDLYHDEEVSLLDSSMEMIECLRSDSTKLQTEMVEEQVPYVVSCLFRDPH